jgi:hypothetical protein
MTAKLITTTDQKIQAVAHCPVANQQVTAGPSKQISFPGGQAIWWQCPLCQGWHIFTNEEAPGGAIHNSTIN